MTSARDGSQPERFRLDVSRTGFNRPSETQQGEVRARSDAAERQCRAGRAELWQLPKLDAAGSIPVVRSLPKPPSDGGFVVLEAVSRLRQERAGREGSGSDPSREC